MSTTHDPAPPPGGPPHLTVVPTIGPALDANTTWVTGAGQVSAKPESWSVRRPPLARLCAGEPLLLTDDEVDLVDLINRAGQLTDLLLDDAGDPDDYRLAEVLVEQLCHRYGIQRHADGDRIKDQESAHRRHLLPFLIELDATRPAGDQGVGALRLRQLENLPRMLAGDAPLPAATVAGDQLGRRGIACVYLDLGSASRITNGGARALNVASTEGRLPVHTDVRTNEPIIRTADLRTAGLLIEPETHTGSQGAPPGKCSRTSVSPWTGPGTTARGFGAPTR